MSGDKIVSLVPRKASPETPVVDLIDWLRKAADLMERDHPALEGVVVVAMADDGPVVLAQSAQGGAGMDVLQLVGLCHAAAHITLTDTLDDG